MKTGVPDTTHAIALIVAGTLCTATLLATELSPFSTLQVQPKGANSIAITIANPSDQVWIIQRSSDFIHWSEVDSWKVHNGIFHSTFNSDPSSPNFFRALYDPSRQDILSTTENALLLPAPSFNYSNPILPPSFHVPPILGQ